MKEYLKPEIEEEIILIEDVIASSNLSVEEESPTVGGGDNTEVLP